MKIFAVKRRRDYALRKSYGRIISLVAWSCGSTAMAQTNVINLTNIPTVGIITNIPLSTVTTNVPPAVATTNITVETMTTNIPVADLSTNAALSSDATSTNAPASASTLGGATNVMDLGNITVVGHLEQPRSSVLPDLGVTAFTQTKEQIMSGSQGDDAPFSQIILRAPGVAQDSAANGDLHVRGEHANLQYRINDVLLPEGISGFGLELDPRFVDSMALLTGALPAQYGFRTAGVVDIHTKSGAFADGGDVEMYGGSHDTLRPSFEDSGTIGKWNYFIDGSYEHNDLGIENPTPSADALHDSTDQYKTFLYASRILSDTSRISIIGSASYADFQIPIDPGLSATVQGNGEPWTGANNPSPTTLNDNQNEQNYFGVVAYQQSVGDLNLQVAGFGRNSSVHYVPGDLAASLDYNSGVATDEKRSLYSGGLQADATYDLGDKHTLRGGILTMEEMVSADTITTVFQTDTNNDELVPNEAPESINQQNSPDAFFYGMYLEDEWKIVPKLTFNYGSRFDVYSSSFDNENQISPRANLVYQPTDSTTLHAGYSRYFTPPPLETVPAGDLAAFNGTTGASGYPVDTSVKAERANYYDIGVSQKLAPGWQAGLDGYYKTARNQLDDGLFGQSLILSSFNYSQGRIGGVEFSTSYTAGGFSTYANVAYAVAQGKGDASAQFLWGNPYVANYVNNHWIYLDHDQRITGSFGTSYTWKEGTRNSTQVYMDALYGSGLRQDGGPIAGDPDGDGIPNGASVPAYYSINMGAEQSFKLSKKRVLKTRLDIVNLTDNVYQLRSGSGVGVNAAQYGARLGFFGSVSYSF